MADTTKKNVDNASTKGKRVTVTLPRLPGQNARQEEFFSSGGKNYLIKRGIEMEIPEDVAELIRDNNKAEEYAINYVDDLERAQRDKEKELGV